MKKLMIALTAVAMAAGVQAASYTWSGSDILSGFSTSTEEYATENIAPGMAYFFIQGVNGADYATITAAVEAGNFASMMSKALDTAAVSATAGGFSGTFPLTGQDTYPDYEGYSAFAVIVNDGTVTEYGTGKQLEKYPDSYAYYTTEKVIPEQETFGGAQVRFGSQYDDSMVGDNWYKQSAVPEPTSGLLLLLGVAGLALRRRRA